MQIIQHIELSSPQNPIEFTNIPSIYSDLFILTSFRLANSVSYQDVYIRFNDSTTNYSARGLEGNGSTASSFSETSQTALLFGISAPGASATSNTFGSLNFYIPNYAGSNSKSISLDNVWENNATAAGQRIYAGLWSNSAAITKIAFLSQGGNFAQYSSATLYGILKGSSGGVTVS